MSHFYRQRGYTYNETDEMMTEIKKEMSNFLTKEEAEIILNRKSVIVDPNPAYLDNKLENVYLEMQKMREEIYNLRTALYKLQRKFEVDEPTL